MLLIVHFHSVKIHILTIVKNLDRPKEESPYLFHESVTKIYNTHLQEVNDLFEKMKQIYMETN